MDARRQELTLSLPDRIPRVMGDYTRLAQIFGNSVRELALSIGKKNFFTFGGVLDSRDEADIARFTAALR